MLRFPRLIPDHMPGLWRSGSPVGGSTLITRAPRSASMVEQNGPGTFTVISTTVRPRKRPLDIISPGSLPDAFHYPEGPDSQTSRSRSDSATPIAETAASS